MNDRITRRELLRRGAAGGAILTFPSLVAACGGDDGIEGQERQEPKAAPTDTTLAETLVFANWPLYIDVNEETKKRPTLQQFQRQTGVKVRYVEEVNDNEEWFGKYQAQLKAGDDIGRDLVVLTDWMAARMIRLGYLEKKNKDAIPNEQNLQDALAKPGWYPNS